MECVPKDKFDIEAVKKASALGYPSINSILPELLEWLKDGNWPVAKEIAPLLTKAGFEIAPHISTILNSDDNLWKYWILSDLVRHLDPRVCELIKKDVSRISLTPTDGERTEGVDVLADELLKFWSNSSDCT